MQKNRVKQALAPRWFGLGSNFRINSLLNKTLVKKNNQLIGKERNHTGHKISTQDM